MKRPSWMYDAPGMTAERWEAYDAEDQTDLNRIRVEINMGSVSSGAPIREQVSCFRTNDTIGSVRTIFNNLESELVARIMRAQAVIGCMAWLTSAPILSALATRKFVSIAVQKEDWLRPDGQTTKASLMDLYAALPVNTLGLKNPGSGVELCPVRCVGLSGKKQYAMPRMHHKFFVFCDIRDGVLEPRAVWTGSFNATGNATRSLENAVIIEDAKTARKFRREWNAVMRLSEPLNWHAEWVAPDYSAAGWALPTL